MKEKLLQEVGLLIDSPDKLINKLVAMRYDFAAWRLPGDSLSYLLIDLNSNQKTNYSRPIEELSNAFIINPFRNNHPPQPKVLNGDVIIRLDHHDPEINVAPNVSDREIEKLYHDIHTNIDEPGKGHAEIESYMQDFTSVVEKAIKEIKEGQAHKIVISRFEEFQLPNHFSYFKCLKTLEHEYPNAFVYFTHTKEYGLWMGASPEKLISVKEQRFFETESLAGTQYLPDQEDLSEVAWTQKEIEEQAMVSRYIIDCLKRIRLREFEEYGPKTVRAGKLVHLKTSYKVDMIDTNMTELGSIMLDLLHPTSAVCGSPFEKAYEFILSNEGYDRSLYSGFLGPVNFMQKTNIFVNLRCMQLIHDKARLYAGAGITEFSRPDKEFQETANKMRTLRDLL